MKTNTETLHLDATSFDEATATGVALVDFWAPWCGPCVALGPTIERLASEYEGRATIAKVNVDQAPEIGQRFAVSSIPTVVFLKDGVEVARSVGLRQHADLAAMLDELID